MNQQTLIDKLKTELESQNRLIEEMQALIKELEDLWQTSN